MCPSFVKAGASCLSAGTGSIDGSHPALVRSESGTDPTRLFLALGRLLKKAVARLQRVVELRLRDEQHIVGKQLLARLALAQLLDALVAVLALHGAGRRKAHEVIVALQLADLDLVGQA